MFGSGSTYLLNVQRPIFIYVFICIISTFSFVVDINTQISVHDLTLNCKRPWRLKIEFNRSILTKKNSNDEIRDEQRFRLSLLIL